MRRSTPVPLTCTHCQAPFSLTPQAHARRLARYGQRLLCTRCLADSWLHSWQGRMAAAHLLCDEAEAGPDTARHSCRRPTHCGPAAPVPLPS